MGTNGLSKLINIYPPKIIDFLMILGGISWLIHLILFNIRSHIWQQFLKSMPLLKFTGCILTLTLIKSCFKAACDCTFELLELLK